MEDVCRFIFRSLVHNLNSLPGASGLPLFSVREILAQPVAGEDRGWLTLCLGVLYRALRAWGIPVKWGRCMAVDDGAGRGPESEEGRLRIEVADYHNFMLSFPTVRSISSLPP